MLFARLLVIIIFFFTLVSPVLAQEVLPSSTSLIKTKLLAKYTEQRNRLLSRQLDRIEEKLVSKMEAMEEELRYLILKTDSMKTQHLAPPATKLQAPDTASLPVADYAEMDRAITANRFVLQAPGLASGTPTGNNHLGNATEKLKTQLARVTAINRFADGISEKLNYYREVAGNINGAGKLVAQLERSKRLLLLRMEQLRQKALQLSKTEMALFDRLNQVQGFAAFRRLHSGIAALFPFANNGAGPLSQGQLQTTASVNQLLPSGIASFTPSTGIRTPQMEAEARKKATALMQALRNKAQNLQGGDAAAGETNVAAARGTSKKRKPFSIQFDAQFNRPNGIFPVTAQIGVRSGYTFRNTPLQAGVGIAYNAGLGTSFRNIALSNEGVSLRSFFEWKQKRGLLLYGGYEMSHLNRFASLPGLQKSDQWRRHALAGISKQYAIGKKWKGSFLLAYDFLHNTRAPVTSPLIFRTGFGL
jgi:hypothetical protein